jgi:hypothetical protein
MCAFVLLINLPNAEDGCDTSQQGLLQTAFVLVYLAVRDVYLMSFLFYNIVH